MVEQYFIDYIDITLNYVLQIEIMVGNMNDYCKGLDELILLDESIKHLNIFIAYTVIWFDKPPKSDLSGEFSRVEEYLRRKYTLEDLKNDPVIRAYRDFYWRIGIDPTKTRPSGEALARRVLRGRGLPRINPIVDAGNIASAHTFIPVGLYDLDRASPPLILRLSRGGEVFKPIGGKDRILEKGIPILVDSSGRVLHIYPYRDSRETCITSNTRNVLIVGAGVPRVPIGYVVKTVEKIVELLEKIGGSSCDRIVLKKSTYRK